MFSKKIAWIGAVAALAVATTAVAAVGDVTFINVEQGSGWGDFRPKFTINRHNDAHSNGALINLWTHNDNASQKWRWVQKTLRSKTNPGYCLNLHNNTQANGATINLWSCNNNPSQNWVVVGDTLRPDSNRDFCVNIHNNVRQDGALINLWECNGHQSQNFRQNIETVVK